MHTEWKNIVLSSYPKILVSPEREITGLGAIMERRKELTKATGRRNKRPETRK